MAGEPLVTANWIPDRNRWNLPAPPVWWLRQLREFDAEVVLLPSRKERRYMVTRRRGQLSKGLGDVAMVDNRHPDTNMFYEHGVLPIAPLNVREGASELFTQASIDDLIAGLKARDTWALTGFDKDPDAAWKAVEEAERQTAIKQRRSMREHFYYLGRDAWRSLQARAGWRNRRASDYHGVARMPKPASGGTAQ